MDWLNEMPKNVIKARRPFKLSTLPSYVGIALSLDPFLDARLL